MTITLHIKTESIAEQISVEDSLQKLANNISAENLKFLASVSQKPDVNKKLKSKHTLIKTFL